MVAAACFPTAQWRAPARRRDEGAHGRFNFTDDIITKGNGPRAGRRPISNRGASKLGSEAAVCKLIMAVSKPAAIHNVAIVNLFNVLELPVLTSFCRNSRKCGRTLHVHLFFGDERESENFAFSIDRHGANIPAIRPQTEWFFLEAINTLKIPDAGDSDDFQHVVEHLKADGYYLLQDEPVDLGLFVPPPQSPV